MNESISSDHVRCMHIRMTHHSCFLVKQIRKINTWL